MEDNQNVGENTSTESQVEATASNQAEDPIKNLKAEMNRKLENTNAQLQALLAAINTQNKPAPSEPAKKVSVFEDEEAYAARVVAEAEARIEKKLAKEREQQTKQAQTINQLVMEFPELAQQDHSLTKRAVEIYNSLSDDEKNSPIAYKAAVKEAALELDIKPKAKRSQQRKEDDSFSLGGSSQGSKRPAPASEVDKVRESLAEAFGIKLTPEVKERLKSNAKKDFKRFS
jgi:hypothetical protein